MNDLTHYDIIADIHGRFDKLEALMECLGYEREGDGFVPPTGHVALFLGDLIDPKPGHSMPGGVRATLRAVKTMCDNGDALCIMGNHELNAILYHSKGSDDEWLRAHNEKNERMHKGTVDDFPDSTAPSGEWMTVWMPWLKSLPFYLDLGGLRAVHACWHPEMISRVEGKTLHDEAFLLAVADEETHEYKALETLLKGVEVSLPPGATFEDHTGAVRDKMRARWWEIPFPTITYRELVFPPNAAIPSKTVEKEAFDFFKSYPLNAPPVFFGHYFKPADSPHSPERENVACLDHSAATGGPLMAYRWKDCIEINPAHYTSHE